MTRYLATLVLLAGTAAYVLFHPPVNLAEGRGALRATPQRFGDWSGTELSFEDAVVDELRADDLLLRRYERGRDVVWLCVIYHQNRRYGAHDPTLCYESQGYVVESPGRARVAEGSPAGLEVNRFVADRQHERRLVYYWWTTAGLSTTDAGAFRSRIALSGALDNRAWGAFVRVETLVHGRDDAEAEARLGDFASRVAHDLPAVFAAASRRGGQTR